MKVLFVEPPKVLWFVMGEYMPPPLGILQLAAYLESKKMINGIFPSWIVRLKVWAGLS